MPVSFVTNAGALAARKRVLADQTVRDFHKVAEAQAFTLWTAANILSSGPLSTMQLRAMGHPYARRFPPGRAGLMDAIINAQSQRFKNSWRTLVTKSPGGWTITLWNAAPYSAFMMGTSRMRPRPILEEIMRRNSAQLNTLTRVVITRAIQQNATGIGAGTEINPWAIAVFAGTSSVLGALERAI